MRWVTETTRFEEVTRRAEKRYTCSECGKRKTKRTTVCQTLNPFNKNAEGEVKTRAEIHAELQAQADFWVTYQPETCDGCWWELPREEQAARSRARRDAAKAAGVKG